MNRSSGAQRLRCATIIGLLALLAAAPALAGPPFQTDDPEPIDYKHYEFYTFATADRVPGETDTVGPAVEFNWGALPNTHLHIIVPVAGIIPSEGPRVFGLGDIELGVKYRFVQETKHRPMIGTFVMFEIPTGSASRALGEGKTWYNCRSGCRKALAPGPLMEAAE
jgi:hypothetical protein